MLLRGTAKWPLRPFRAEGPSRDARGRWELGAPAVPRAQSPLPSDGPPGDCEGDEAALLRKLLRQHVGAGRWKAIVPAYNRATRQVLTPAWFKRRSRKLPREAGDDSHWADQAGAYPDSPARAFAGSGEAPPVRP